MVNTARENASTQGLHPPHFSIVQTDLESELPLKSDSVNCIMSNCVINLLSSAAKASLFKELFRVLAPGGRLCIDDIVAKKDMPDAVRNDLASHVGCFAGALSSPEYEAVLREAGFQGELPFRRRFVRAYTSFSYCSARQSVGSFCLL